jgi:ABC-type Zn2+ transport system substrate-binding protein/surface adhesin
VCVCVRGGVYICTPTHTHTHKHTHTHTHKHKHTHTQTHTGTAPGPVAAFAVDIGDFAAESEMLMLRDPYLAKNKKSKRQLNSSCVSCIANLRGH